MRVLLSFCLVFFLFPLLSCQDMGTARFVVYNKSRVRIDSLFFAPSDSVSRHYLNLSPGEVKRYNLSMKGLKTDGAYGIKFRKGSETVSHGFGYFSNGAAMEDYTVVEIWDDTVIIKPKY